MVSEGIFINGEKVTFNPENILTGDISTYTEQIGEATQDWLDEHLEPGGSVPIDDTLTISGSAADAKKTGDEIAELNDGLTDVGAVLHYKNPTIIDGKTVTTTGTTADPTSFNTESGWSCAVDDCKPGEVYTISGHGGANTRLWCFIDEDNNVLAAADIGKTVDDLRLVVPPKAVKIICNFQPSAHTVKLTKIMGVFYTDYELKNRNAAADALRVGEEVGLINDHLSQLRTNEVRGKVDALLGARWSLNHISTDNGQDKNNGYNCRTDNYISVADADGYLHYKMSSPAGIRLFLFFYNSAKEWISHDAGTLHTGTYEGQVALPTGTAYIRFLLSNEDWGMFDTISDATDYFEAWFVPESGEEKKFETIYGARIEEAAQIYEGDAAAARLGYIWISDLHFKKNWADNTTALKRQLKAVARLANRTSVDFVCIGGDIVDSETEADDLFENINYWLSPLAECNKPVIYLIGNHDDNAYGEWIGKLPAKGLFVDRGEYHNDICAPTSDAGYFYFDIDRKGVRVVCLDTIDYESRSGKNGSNWWSLSQSQVEWFCQKALDTPYDIVILSHMTPDYDNNSWHLGNEGGYHSDLISAIAAYNARGTMTLYSKTFDFTEAEGYIKMMHVGHAHFEFEAAKTVGGIPCIFTSCAKQYGQAQQSYETAVTGKDDTYTIASSVAYDTHHQNTTGYEYKRYTTRTLDTISEALFDLVSVKNTRADFYRIGAGEDRQVTLQATNPRQYDDQIAKTREEVDDLKSGISDLKEDLNDKVDVNGENQVSIENAVFLDAVGVNVCDGVPHDGYAVVGDQINGYRLVTNAARYNLMIAKIKPNTTYTVIAQMTDASVMPLFRLVTSEQIVAVNEQLTGSVSYEVSNRTKITKVFTTGANDNYAYIYGISYTSPARDYFIQIAEGVIDDFTTDKYSWYVGYPNDRLKLTYKDAYTPKIKIIPQSATQFTVNVLDETSGEYIGHRFGHLRFEDMVSYGTSQSKTIITEDVWYASYIIAPNGDCIMQGNTNFIHYVGNMSGHEGHVGAGHGCCVAMVERFLADGKEFVPSELTSPIECSAFTFIEVVKHYLNDRQKSMEMFPTSYSSHAIPTLDSNGDPIVTGIEYLVGEWSGNSVKIRNRFDIKLDNISFQQCHAGMLTGFYPYFTDFAINSKPYVWNHTHSDDYVRTNVYTSDSGCTFVNTDVCGSGVVVNPASSPVYMADEVFMLGEKYFAKKRMIQNVPTRYDKSNVMMWVPPNGDARLKAYFMPCICTSHATGETAEVFNDGDVLDTNVELVIGVHAAQ